MDLSARKVVERTIDILDPATKAETGLKVTLMSPRDPRLDKLRKQISQKQLSLQVKNKVPNIDEIKNDRKLILFTAITRWDWTGEANWKGEHLELNRRNFNEVCDEAEWIQDQIDEAFGELESFFQPAE